jgi:hypothetical protein
MARLASGEAVVDAVAVVFLVVMASLLVFGGVVDVGVV